jgi:hypothetical protein
VVDFVGTIHLLSYSKFSCFYRLFDNSTTGCRVGFLFLCWHPFRFPFLSDMTNISSIGVSIIRRSFSFESVGMRGCPLLCKSLQYDSSALVMVVMSRCWRTIAEAFPRDAISASSTLPGKAEHVVIGSSF